MAYGNIKTLARGQAHATSSAVYTGPTQGKSTEVAMIWLHNTNVAAMQVRLYHQENVTSSLFFNESLASNETFEVSPKLPIVINGTGSLFIVAASSASVNYIITGREEV